MGTAAPGPGNTRLRDNTITGVTDSNRHAGHRHALSQDFRILTCNRVHITDVPGSESRHPSGAGRRAESVLCVFLVSQIIADGWLYSHHSACILRPRSIG